MRELRTRLGHYISAARRGEPVLIKKQGKPVARLVGWTGRASRDLGLELTALGIAEWNGGKPRGLDHPARVLGGSADDFVVEDRR